jgi:hypothetical protein
MQRPEFQSQFHKKPPKPKKKKKKKKPKNKNTKGTLQKVLVLVSSLFRVGFSISYDISVFVRDG